MYEEFNLVPVHSMSNLELILVEDEEERIEFDTVERRQQLLTEFQEECCDEATSICDNSSSDDDDGDHIPDDDHHEEKIGEEINAIAGGNSKEMVDDDDDDDDDGFKTPTSMDQKIPEMKQCPAAPRKSKANKRKSSTSSTAVNPLLDFSQEVESWLTASLVHDLSCKVKKTRTRERIDDVN